MTPTAAVWQRLFVDLAVHVTVAVAATALLSRWLTRSAWRRPFWQACTLALLGVFLFEIVGLNHELAGPLGRLIGGSDNSAPPVTPANRCRETSILPEGGDRNLEAKNESGCFSWIPKPSFDMEHRATIFRTQSENSAQPPADKQLVIAESELIDIQPAENKSESSWLTVWWPGLLWLLGTGLVAGRAASARLLLVFFRLRHPAIQDSEFLTRLHTLARQLGIRRAIHVIQVPSLISPFTFGTFRPVIAVPPKFIQDLDLAKQEVMLAHELAHLAGHDPSWFLAADLMTALLWWHPLSWGCRHQLHSACEADADQASSLFANGPEVLAVCLVELAGQLVNNPQVGGASVAGNGFRSSLGRRVDRLLNLNGQTWTRPLRRRLLVVLTTVAPILLLVATLSAVCLPGSGFPGKTSGLSKGDETMTSWRHSIAGMALCVFLTPATDTVVAQESSKPAPDNPTSERKTAETPRPPADSVPEPPPAGVTLPSKGPLQAPAPTTESSPNPPPAAVGSAVASPEPGQTNHTVPVSQRIKIFRLTHRQPAEMLQLFRPLVPMFEGGAQGAPIPYTDFLSESGNANRAMDSGSGFRVATMMADMKTMPEGGGSRSGATGVSSPTVAGLKCYFAIDSRTSSLIVRGTEKDLQVVADFVAIFDLPDDKPIPKLKNVHAFKLRFAKPNDVIEVLKALNINVLVALIPKSTILLVNGPDVAIKEATEIIEALDADIKEGAKTGPENESAPAETTRDRGH